MSQPGVVPEGERSRERTQKVQMSKGKSTLWLEVGDRGAGDKQ